jgi:hypothetical protein
LKKIWKYLEKNCEKIVNENEIRVFYVEVNLIGGWRLLLSGGERSEGVAIAILRVGKDVRVKFFFQEIRP